MRVLLCVLFIIVMSQSSYGKFKLDTPLENPQAEARAQALFAKLRCKVCEGQDISSSGAELAVAMRRVIRDQIQTGRSNDDILTYLTSRYGEDVLLAPPATRYNSVLWIAPILLLMLGFVLIWRLNRANA